jgi:multidrug transporter EmrE-like cation transporter
MEAAMIPVFILAGGGALMTIGDIVMKKWALGQGGLWGVLGLFMWFLGLLCLAATMKQTNIAIASIMLIYFNVVILAVAEYTLFGTPVTTTKILGGILGLVAISIMEL